MTGLGRIAAMGFCLALVALLPACSGKSTGPASAESPATVTVDRDGLGDRRLRPDEIIEPVPREEPLARYGNHSPYEVFGKRYTVMNTSAGYDETGLASWYGAKFHGRRTSSGEPYDMYKASAAHRSLPLPTYAEVTNLDNGNKVVVKVNDRGPFHSDRIIDLSYAAAVKLDMVNQGTARVRVRTLTTTNRTEPSLAQPQATAGILLQVGAFSSRAGARRLSERLIRAGFKPISIQQPAAKPRRHQRDRDPLYRVWIGPLASVTDANRVADRVERLGLGRPHRVKQ